MNSCFTLQSSVSSVDMHYMNKLTETIVSVAAPVFAVSKVIARSRVVGDGGSRTLKRERPSTEGLWIAIRLLRKIYLCILEMMFS